MKKLMAVMIALSSVSANAGMICREYSASGDLKLTHICAHESSNGTFTRPTLTATNHIAWPISVGLFPTKRAKKACHALGLNHVVSFSVSSCSQEQSALNLKGNYESSNLFSYGTGQCISELICKP